MPVYVDDMNMPYRGMRMFHMIAGSTEELVAMADLIGVQRRWLQHAGTAREHFDIAKGKRDLALQHGAVGVTWSQLGHMVMVRRLTGILGEPETAKDEVRRLMRKTGKTCGNGEGRAR